MKFSRVALSLSLALATAASFPTSAQRLDPKATIAAQRTAMQSLAMLDGQWRGPGSMTTPDGSVKKFTQTERIGSLLDGSIRLIEGRSYDDAGNTVFNAFAVVSYDPATRRYTMHSHAQGMVGDFNLTPTADGFQWEIPAGPATIRYTAVVKDGHFDETGERIVAGQAPVTFFTMHLTRIGESTWPGSDAIAPR